MKRLRAKMDGYFDKLDERWRALPVGRQHKYTLYFFIAYLILTAGILSKVWYDARKPDKNMVIEHIENPVLKKKERPAILEDTLSTILKNRIYEGK